MPLTHISRFAILIQCDSKFYTLSLPPPDLATLPFIHTSHTIHVALYLKEINNRIRPIVKHVWNVAMHVLHIFGEF